MLNTFCLHFSIAEIQEKAQPISGALLSSPPHLKNSHLPITAAPTVQETATRIAQPLCEPNNTEEIVFRYKLPNSTNVEYEKLVFDAILNTDNSVEVENQEECNVVYIPKNNSEVIKRGLVETVSDTTCDFDFKSIKIDSSLEFETVTKLTDDVIPYIQPVNLNAVDNGANSKTLSNTKYSDLETVSSTTLSNGNDLAKTIQSQIMNREEQFNATPDSELKPQQKNMNREVGVNPNSNYCNANFQDLVMQEHSAKHDLVKTQPDNETNRESATFYKTNPAETTPVSSHNITAIEYILRKQQKSSYVELNTAVPDPRLRGAYLCFEEAVMLSDENKVEIFKNISAKQATNVGQKKFKKRDEKDLRKLVYKKDENNLDSGLKLQTDVTDHNTRHQCKKEKIPRKKRLISVPDKTPESSLKQRLRSAKNVLSSFSPPEQKNVKPVSDAFPDEVPQMCPPPSINPQLLASSRLFPPIKSLENLSSSLLRSFNPVFNKNAAKESKLSKINDCLKSESSRMSTSESSTTNTHSSPLSITEKEMEEQLELKSKVESDLQLENPFPKELTVSLCSKDTVHRHSDQPSPSVSMQNIANNQIPPCPTITDSINKMQEPKTIHDSLKSRLKDFRKQPKCDSLKDREDHTLLSAIQNTQIQKDSNPYYIESNPNGARNIEVLTARQNTTKKTDQQRIGRKATRSQKLLQNLMKDVASQSEGLDLSDEHQNSIDGESNRNSNIIGNNYNRSWKEVQSDKTVNKNSNVNYKHYYRKRFDLLPDVHINPPPPLPPNQINQPSDAQRRQAHCRPQETHVTHDPNYLNPTYPSVPDIQQHYGSSIYPVCPTPNMATNNIPTITHNNHFVDYQVFQRNPNNHNQYSPCNPVPNYQPSYANLQSTQDSQRQVTNPHYINPNSALSTQSYGEHSTHLEHSPHSHIRFPPPQVNIGPSMFARSYSSCGNPMHPHHPQKHTAFPPLEAHKQQFLQNHAKRLHPTPPQAQPKRISRRRSSMFQ